MTNDESLLAFVIVAICLVLLLFADIMMGSYVTRTTMAVCLLSHEHDACYDAIEGH